MGHGIIQGSIESLLVCPKFSSLQFIDVSNCEDLTGAIFKYSLRVVRKYPVLDLQAILWYFNTRSTPRTSTCPTRESRVRKYPVASLNCVDFLIIKRDFILSTPYLDKFHLSGDIAVLQHLRKLEYLRVDNCDKIAGNKVPERLYSRFSENFAHF